MALIFSASSDRLSFRHSSRIIGPIVRWLFPHLSDHAVRNIVFGVRKGAHMTEYGILALLLWRPLRKPVQSQAHVWHWPAAGFVLSLVALYAASDEFHQRFVPSREASVWDVLLDILGAVLALLALRRFGRWQKAGEHQANP